MAQLITNRNIFGKSFQEIKQNLFEQQGNILKKDKCIAEWLGLKNLGLVTIIRKATKIYSQISYKQAAGKTLISDEDTFVKYRDAKNKNAVQTKTILRDNECRIMDYGLEEIWQKENFANNLELQKEKEEHNN
ncbi:41219_t:CDS:2 [Gigaspora margarita]|uniref:41219_t:CDS:1 n=1 Tax=Gigaspora margarita TaxID=4874 RepID=A0ABM8W5C8_GIGMA|nr:41219_t:CDS:2 [Gigaspora margarita]